MPAATRRRDLVDGGDRAVGGDQQLRPARGQALDRRRRQAVAVLAAAGQKPVDVGAERAQHADEDRRRADPVDVVVAVDRDAPARAHVVEHALADGVDAGERRRVVPLARGQPGPRGAGVGQAAPHEHLCRRVAHAELALEREHGGDVARGDLQAWRVRRHAREATGRVRRKRVAVAEFGLDRSSPCRTSELRS